MLFWIIILLVVLIIFLQNGKDREGRGNLKQRLSNKANRIKDYILKKSESDTRKKSNNLRTQKTDMELYFVKYIERKDQLALVRVTRRIRLSGTPLKDVIILLLKGPTLSEEKRKITSVFLGNTKLRSARIKKDIAYLDFNSEIESGVGISTLQARLYQVVYTATQFPEVNGVKILINGKAKNAFSTEGLSIRSPLRRLNREPIF